MTNERYLVVSYFCAAAGGILAAILTALALRSPLGKAVSAVLSPVGKVLRRSLPAWLILAVLFAFVSVNYINCGHSTYKSVVEDREYLELVTCDQIGTMMHYLCAAMLFYAMFLSILMLLPRRERSLPDKSD